MCCKKDYRDANAAAAATHPDHATAALAGDMRLKMGLGVEGASHESSADWTRTGLNDVLVCCDVVVVVVVVNCACAKADAVATVAKPRPDVELAASSAPLLPSKPWYFISEETPPSAFAFALAFFSCFIKAFLFDLHESEHVVISSQHRSHFLRHVNGLLQTTHTFDGRFCFATDFLPDLSRMKKRYTLSQQRDEMMCGKSTGAGEDKREALERDHRDRDKYLRPAKSTRSPSP